MFLCCEKCNVMVVCCFVVDVSIEGQFLKQSLTYMHSGTAGKGGRLRTKPTRQPTPHTATQNRRRRANDDD